MRILIVGSMNGQVGAASQIAMKRGARVSLADSVKVALDLMRTGRGGDLILMDAALQVIDLVKGLKTERINTPVVACGIGTNSRQAVAAIKAGAKEFIPLPPDPEIIAAVLAAVAGDERTVIANDAAMTNVMRMADQVASSRANILITGESGTGKEVMARYLHEKSGCSGDRFVAVNCAAIPENLLESELFGHEKGAFTGAVARRLGKFEEANGGTLLLDEISEMDVRLQAKLLRAIQEKEIDRVGGTKPIPVNVRIVATSNRNLSDEVKKGTFREDLMFRLNVMNLNLPPLRERTSDILSLAEYFIKKFSKINSMDNRPLDPEVLPFLTSYQWPGNVRELENTMHRAVLLAAGDTIGLDSIVLPDGTRLDQLASGSATKNVIMADTPESATQLASAFSRTAKEVENDGNAVITASGSGGLMSSGLVGMTVAEVERDLIIDTLKHCLGNRTHAATTLGISIRTLRNKLRQYTDDGISVPQPGSRSS